MSGKVTVRIGGRVFTLLFPDLLRPLSAAERSRLSAGITRAGRVLVPLALAWPFLTSSACVASSWLASPPPARPGRMRPG